MKWFEQLAAYLKSKGHHRMIYRGCDKAIDSRGFEEYLERFYILSKKWIGTYLHRFWASDEDCGVHNHPFHFFTIIIKGGYYEEIPIDPNNPFGETKILDRKVGFPFIRFHRKSYAHRIILKPGTEGQCWTLFCRFCFKRSIWGFYKDGTFKPAVIQSRKDERM